MRSTKSIWVNRMDYRQTQIVEEESRALEDGEIRVAIDKAALTSNNISYAVGGDMIGYWNYYPASGDWGQVPVWGMADVVDSRSADIEVGERLWGFYPMANETILKVRGVRPDAFMEGSDHRAELPALYNQYRRTKAEPEFMREYEDQRALFVPLFGTSYVLYDYLVDNNLFGAQQILIGSVSSKTGFGLAQLLSSDPDVQAKVIGITSPGNTEFVRSLECCHEVVAYGQEATIDAGLKSTYVDMSGNRVLTETLHEHIRENIVESCMVGGTHWEARGQVKELPGATPTFFFTPAQIEKRNKEWGVGVLGQKATRASFELAQRNADRVQVEYITGAEDVTSIWREMLDNKVAANRGIMISIR